MRLSYSCGNNLIKKDINDLPLELLSSNENEIIDEISKLNKNKAKVHDIPTEETIDLLDKCAKLWLDPDYSRKHIEILAQITNQSCELVTYELESTVKMLLKENIQNMIVEELAHIDVLDNWIETSYGYVHRQPRGLTFHNISGNAFVVIPVSISVGLLSKNCNLIKVSGDEPYFAYAFYKSLLEIDETVKDRLSIVYFDSSSSNIYETLVKSSNCVIHWGGEQSGRIMAELCAKYQTHLIMHGAKISFEVIDNTENLSDIAKLVARDIIFWEQKACLSPRIVFINNKIDVESFSMNLAEAIRVLTNELPKAYFSAWNSVKTIQDRQYCIVKYGVNDKLKVYSSFNADYTVMLNKTMPDKEDIDKCFHRFIFVCPYEKKEDVLNYVEKNLKNYLQTMGYSGTDNEFLEKMTLLGVSIVTRPGEMPMHYPGTSHDGIHNLQEMTYVVSKQF